MNTYNSIVPSQMTNSELQSICTEIQTAKNWGQDHAVVKLANGCQYKVEVSRHQDYQEAFKINTGAIPRITQTNSNPTFCQTENKITSELKTEHLVYMSDEMYTPIHYKGMLVKQPFFEGKGNHSVAQLEAICEQFKEYVHQQQIIKQNCMKHIVELKFGVEFPQNEA